MTSRSRCGSIPSMKSTIGIALLVALSSLAGAMAVLLWQRGQREGLSEAIRVATSHTSCWGAETDRPPDLSQHVYLNDGYEGAFDVCVPSARDKVRDAMSLLTLEDVRGGSRAYQAALKGLSEQGIFVERVR